MRPGARKVLQAGLTSDEDTDADLGVTLPEFDRSEPATELKGDSPWGDFGRTLVLCVLWNGITWAIVIAMWSDGAGWFGGCFVVPFVLIGLLVFGALVYSILALFNPRPHVHVSAAAVRIGDELRINWSFVGQTSSISTLQVQLIGTEHASFRRGTDSVNRESVFLREVLFEDSGGMWVSNGSCTARIPELVPSFEGGDNAIRYELRLYGEIHWWADVDSEYPIVILPKHYPKGT